MPRSCARGRSRSTPECRRQATRLHPARARCRRGRACRMAVVRGIQVQNAPGRGPDAQRSNEEPSPRRRAHARGAVSPILATAGWRSKRLGHRTFSRGVEGSAAQLPPAPREPTSRGERRGSPQLRRSHCFPHELSLTPSGQRPSGATLAPTLLPRRCAVFLGPFCSRYERCHSATSVLQIAGVKHAFDGNERGSGIARRRLSIRPRSLAAREGPCRTSEVWVDGGRAACVCRRHRSEITNACRTGG